jgi:geranylgeranyl diphosphate synthase type II
MTTATGSSASSQPASTEELIQRIDAWLGKYLDGRSLPDNLREAMKYAVLGPGKRMRPILVLRSCEAVGGDIASALPPAAAIEMVHAFSLVHDDLPAMDDDDLRRGRPTLHRHTNEAMAILAGDGLLGLAVELLTTCVENESLSRSLVRELTIGTNDMIAGQVYDTLGGFTAEMSAEQKLEIVHHHKTGALIRCACRMGGLCGKADDGQMQALTQYADAIGLMFQVVDDLLDVTQSTEQLGKTAGKDVDQEKLTYPSVMGLGASRREVERLTGVAHGALKMLNGTVQPLHELCDYLAVRTR